MFPASSKSGGTPIGFPDTCKLPAPPAPFAPTPYPNLSYQVQSTVKKGEQKKKKSMDELQATKKKLDAQFDKATRAFGMIDGRFKNTLGFEVNRYKEFAKAVEESMKLMQKTQALLHQTATDTVTHYDTKHRMRLSQR